MLKGRERETEDGKPSSLSRENARRVGGSTPRISAIGVWGGATGERTPNGHEVERKRSIGRDGRERREERQQEIEGVRMAQAIV